MIKRFFKFIDQFLKKATRDSLPAYAAQATFFVLLSFFPFLLMLLMVFSRLSIENTNIVRYLMEFFPTQVQSYVTSTIDDIMSESKNSFTLVTALISFWSAGKGMQALTYGFNRIYGIKENKNFFLNRFICALYTIVFLIACMGLLLVNVFGRYVLHNIIEDEPVLGALVDLAIQLKNLFLFIILFLFLLLIYYKLPNRKGKFKEEAPGAFFGALFWMVLTYAFSAFVRKVSDGSYMYGSLTSIILIIIWLYIGMQIILYGAEVNDYINRKKRAKDEESNS